MTLGSLTLAIAAASLIAPLVARFFRASGAWAVGCAVAIGLMLMNVAGVHDLLRPFRPQVAIDWLPVLSIAAVACASITQWRYRIPVAIAIAMVVPVRLLWGSVYLSSASISLPMGIVLAGWSAALLVVLLLPDTKQHGRLNANVLGWGLAAVAVIVTIAMSGSLTYAAAASVVAIAIASVLLASGQIPSVAAFPFIVLVGLSASFSELQLGAAIAIVAGLLGVAFSAYFADRNARSSAAIRATSFAALLVTTGIIAFRFANDFRTTENALVSDEAAAYEVLVTEEIGASQIYTQMQPNEKCEGQNKDSSGDTLDANSALPKPAGIESIDPFGGLGLQP